MKTASGFTAAELVQYANYLDKYPNTSTSSSYNLRILGDATGEMGPFYNYEDKNGKKSEHNNWYGNNSTFVNTSWSWFERSGWYDESYPGLFFFGRSHGGSEWGTGPRLALAF